MNKLEFIHTIRELIADGKTAEALALMRAKVSEFDASLVTDATLLESRFTNAFSDFAVKGILPREDYDRTTAQINYALLEIVEKLEKTVPLSTGGAKNKNSGRILHNIPGIMPVGKEKRCVVRIAYDDETLLRDLKKDENTVIQDIRIAEVMGVELLDFNETPAFNVRTITEEEQFTSTDDYTQWLFMVKALREGRFPLTLKVAIIEEVNGKERKRDIVLEKEVFIISQIEEPAAIPAPAKPSQPTVTHFEDTSIRINYVAEEQERAVATSTPAQKRFSMSGVISTIGLIVLALTGWVTFQKFNIPENKDIVIDGDGKYGKGHGNEAPTNVVTSDTSAKDAENQRLNDTASNLWAEKNSNQSKDIQAIPNIEPPKKEVNGNASKDIVQTKPNANTSKKEINGNSGNPVVQTKPKTSVPSKGTATNSSQYASQKSNKGTGVIAKPNKSSKSSNNKITTNPTATQSPTSSPQIKIGDVKVVTTPNEVTQTTTTAEPPMRTFKVKLILKGEMKKAAISVDGQPVDKFLRRNLLGTPQYIEFKSNKEKHTITFKRGNVSCSVTDIPVVNGEMTVEPCSF
ncbi:MAG: hypothetical protein JNL70_08855 [Saprospiraceae bacterium]|nr:hypothetical protein [Saprospiraceae bacterium]